MPARSDEDCTNPLYLSWVKELLELAEKRNAKSRTAYKNAYNSLRACPLYFTHPCQLETLNGFGKGICEQLTKRLQDHCNANGLPMPSKKRPRRRGTGSAALDGDDAGDSDDEESQPRPAKKPRKVKAYVPQYRSGPYGILLGLAENNASGMTGLTKAELIDAAQPHCDSSYTVADQANKFYTAWNSYRTLVNKELIVEKKNRARKFYVLTDAGLEVARNIKRAADPSAQLPEPDDRPGPSDRREPRRQAIPIENDENDDNDNLFVESDVEVSVSAPTPAARPKTAPSEYADVVKDEDGSFDPSAIPSFRPIRLQPGSFTIQLIIDQREIRSRTDRDYIQEELYKQGVKPIVKPLPLGDAMWVAKCHDPNFLARTGAEGDEVALDWIAERKRLDDLVSSIKDGRFHEQKFRLKNVGLKNVVYIIEEFNMNEHTRSHYELSVQSAIATTQVTSGFFVKQTQKLDDTIRYLVRITNKLKKLYEEKPLYIIPTDIITRKNYLPLLQSLREKDPSTNHYISYQAFSSLASKSEMMTLRDVYLRFLMCIRGVTGEKALAIQKKWKTPRDLIEAFDDIGSGEVGRKKKNDMVFNELGNQPGGKKMTKALSAKIAGIWAEIPSQA
jgi:crossover junction endonuclease MUS81